MKILISIGTLGLGGAEKQAVWLANRLSDLHEVTLLTYHGGMREKDLSPKVNWRTIYEIQDKEKNEEINSQGLIIEERALPQSLIKMESNPFYEVGNRERESITSISRLRLLKEEKKISLKNFPLTFKLLRYLYIKSMPLIQFIKLGLSLSFKSLRGFRSGLTWKNFPKRFIRLFFKWVEALMTGLLQLVRKSLLYLALSRLRQNIKNQTYVFRRARKMVKEVRPDLIITFLFHDTLNVGLAGLTQTKRPRLIVGRRSPIGYGDNSRNYFHKLALKVVYRFADLAVSNSQANIESAISGGIGKRKIMVIENFVAKNDLSSFLPTKVQPLEVLCIANFHWYKNHESLIRAISTIPNHEKNFRFTFIGDGPLLGSIQQLACDLKVSSEFRGFIDNPTSEIPAFHAMVLVSHVEGSSNALLEGLVSGIPALVSKVGATQELMSQGAPLILCDSHDVPSIANGLIQLNANYEVLNAEAREFSKFLSEALSEDVIFKKWQEAIGRVTSA